MRTSKKGIESKEDIDDMPEGMEPVNMHGFNDLSDSDYSNYRTGRELKAYGQPLSEMEKNKLSMERQKCRDIAFRKLQKFGLEIRDKAENIEKKETEGFDITGIKIKKFSKSVVKGRINPSDVHLVPKWVARGYRIYESMLSDPQADPFEKLVKFVATMKYAAIYDAHTGRGDKSTAYYETFITEKGDGATIFPDYPVLAAEFDAAVDSKLAKIRSKHSSENQSRLKEYAAKIGINTAQKDYEDFQEKMENDTRNIAAIKNLISNLKMPENMDESVFYEGKKLLLDTLVRMTMTFSKTDLTLYKEDFLKIIETLDPESSRSSDYKATLEQFFDHHISMMTTLTDRYRRLYVDLAVNAIAIAAQPVAGAVAPLLPTQFVDSVKTATLGTTGAGEVLGATACKTTKAAARDLPTLSTANPIIPVRRPETKSEMLLRLTSKEKQQKLALLGATIIAGVAFGPVGAAIVGVGGGTMLYAKKFYDAHETLSSLENITIEARAMHEQTFCRFCVNLLKDKDNPDMGEIEITLRNEMDRLTAWSQKISSTPTSTPSQSTNNIFVQLHEANPEFDPSKVTEFDPSEVIPSLSHDEEFKPTIPKLVTEAATTTVTPKAAPASSEKETKHNYDEDNTQTPAEFHMPKPP